MVALESETKFLFNGSGKGLAKPLQLVDEDGDGGLGAENVFLFFVDGFALGNSFFHLCDTVVFLAEATESLVDEIENRSIGHVRGRHCSPLLCCSGRWRLVGAPPVIVPLSAEEGKDRVFEGSSG